MKKRYRQAAAVCMTIVMTMAMAAGCGSDNKTAAAEDENDKVFRVGMECNYVPFNWTQETEDLSDGSKAVPIYGSDFYAYGYDVAVAQKLADEMGIPTTAAFHVQPENVSYNIQYLICLVKKFLLR